MLERIEKLEAAKAQLHAQALEARAELAELWANARSGFAEMELAGTALVGQFRAAREIDDARRAAECFPKLRELLAAGAVFVPVAELVLQATRRCTPEVQALVDVRLAGQLVGRNVTDCRRLVQSTILAVEAELDPQLTRDRLDAVRKDARVWVTPGEDGMTSIGAVIEAVAGRRWALDFEALVKAQLALDAQLGIERTVMEVRSEVFANLPSLVLELARAARDGRLAELAEVTELDADTAAELSALAETVVDDAECAEGATGEVRVEVDPYDEALADLDPWAEVPYACEEPPADLPEIPEPGPPPADRAAQDAALWSELPMHGSPQDAELARSLERLVVRCLRMPLPAPTVVNLHVPMTTALDLTHAPGILEGHGPLDAFRIRQLLPSASLREVYVDQSSGVPLGAQRRAERARPDQADPVDLARRIREVTLVDRVEPRHDPSAGLRATVQLRDQRCSGPGCTLAACRCHLDHEDEWPDGPTAEWNLGAKSPRCHGAKHHGWSVVRHPDGRTVWTSPTGRTYTSRSVWQPPPPVPRNVQFVLPRNDVVVEIEIGTDS